MPRSANRSNEADSVVGITPLDSRGPDHRRDIAAMLTSTLIHALFLLVLALWVIPSLTRTARTVEFSVGPTQDFALESMNLPTVEPTAEVADDAPTETTEVWEVGTVEMPPLDFTMSDLPSDVPVAAATNVAPVAFTAESLSTSSSVEGAVDRITAELNEKLERGDLLVVWLLDASNSLVDDRKRVAARLTPFYESLIDGRRGEQTLHSAVVSFGKSMRERVAPTSFGEKIVAAVEDLPVDRSGNEKVFDAVQQCALHYRESWRNKQLVIVIWTDESGDDLHHLEDAIQTCREQRVNVSVVGPSSVLGAETGLHSYIDPKTNSVYQLPVRRGPETAIPERIDLGYWYLTRMGRGPFRRGGRGGALPSWLGGQDLKGILSGFSPYALTRLSMQTGGSYTIFDRPEDRGPFDPLAMQSYAPSYDSYANYVAEIESSPLRMGVMKAVDQLAGKKVDAPQTMLFIKSTGPRVFDFMRFYYPPQEFQAKLRSSRGRLVGQATRYSKLVDAALRHVSLDEGLEEGLESLYQQESSPRWRAWYDLTRGRLLATSVRLEEYRLTIGAMVKPGAMARSTNHAILVASSEMRSDESFQRRADEAERLLRRCAEVNRGTPWETLAQRELDFALGVGVRELSLTQEPMVPSPRQPNLPRF